MANRRMKARIPIWVRAPGIIALVLVGVLLSPILLDAAGVASRSGDGGGHGSGEDMEMEDGGHGSDDSETDSGDHGSRDDRETDSGGHGSGDESDRSDHNQGQGGPAAPSAPGLGAVAAQVVTFTIDDLPIEGMRAEGDRA